MKNKLATLVEGELKAPFLIATTQKSVQVGGHYTILLIALLYPWSLHYNAAG